MPHPALSLRAGFLCAFLFTTKKHRRINSDRRADFKIFFRSKTPRSPISQARINCSFADSGFSYNAK
nr:MAG TPA: hypothetical protein [Caudoviricetes sp.]